MDIKNKYLKRTLFIIILVVYGIFPVGLAAISLFLYERNEK
jgi:flagellar basal body-associated protein FliL